MAEAFTLSTQRMSSGGGGGGLRSDMIQANAGAGNLRAAQISPNAGRINYTATNLPQPVENMVSKGTQHFLGAVSKAAFEYQEREAAYLANEAALEFQIKAREAYSGYEDKDGNFVPGLSSAKGATAVTAYTDYTAALDERMTDMLSGMEPRVKQKALIQLQTAKNQALAKGATHRAQQMQVAEEDQRFRKVAELSAQGAADPSLFRRDENGMLPKDANGVDIQQKVIDQYDSIAEGAKAYWDLIVDVGENIYLKPKSQGGGAEAAMAYAATVGEMELTGSPDHKNTLNSRVQSWMKRDAQAEISAANRRDAVAKKDRDARQEATHADIVAKQDTVKAYTVDMINEKIIEGNLKPSVGAGLKAIAAGASAGQGDPEAYRKEVKIIRNAELVDGVLMVRDDDNKLVPLGRRWAGNTAINKDDIMMRGLDKLASQRGTVTQKQVAEISKNVETMLKGSNPVYQFGADMGELDRLMIGIDKRIESLLEVGEFSPSAIETMVINENLKEKPYLPAETINGFVGGLEGEPRTLGELPLFANRIRQMEQEYIDTKGASGLNRRDAIENKRRFALHKNRLLGEQRQQQQSSQRETN